jgi:hypothetical protein
MVDIVIPLCAFGIALTISALGDKIRDELREINKTLKNRNENEQ